MSQIPEGATHRSQGHYYKKEGPSWMLYGSASQWMETACLWKWLDENAEPLIPEWTGEGLPPVGIDVEIHNKKSRGVVEGAEHFIGSQCTVMATFVNMHGYEIVSVEDSSGACMCFRADMCGPIRTPEQIAAEVRDKAIADLYFTINWNEGRETWPMISSGRKADYAKAIDAGYRKFEIVEE